MGLYRIAKIPIKGYNRSRNAHEEKKHGEKAAKPGPFLVPCLPALLYETGDSLSMNAYDAMPVYFPLSIRYVMALVVLFLFGGLPLVPREIHVNGGAYQRG